MPICSYYFSCRNVYSVYSQRKDRPVCWLCGSVIVSACAGTFIITWDGIHTYPSCYACWSVQPSRYLALGASGLHMSRFSFSQYTGWYVLVLEGLTLIILRGLTLTQTPGISRHSTGYISDIFGDVHLFGVKHHFPYYWEVSGRPGILPSSKYTAIDPVKERIYCENPFALGIKLLVIGAAIIWLFYTLANYREKSRSLHHPLRSYWLCQPLTSSTVVGRHLYTSGR